MEDKKEKKETKTQEQIILNGLDAEQAERVHALFNTVAKAKVNSFVAKDIGAKFNGSEKAIFLLGVSAGENNVIRQLKAIIGQEQ
jgi:uncharacterized ferredoxin-like protein